ncbi:MAG: hypothetical protein LBB23_02755 [Rickettsiales bacterium]|nr:hypothetical protein [Rickettsiales bacterium]
MGGRNGNAVASDARDRNPLLYACRDVKTSVTGAGANAGASLTDADYANSTAIMLLMANARKPL